MFTELLASFITLASMLLGPAMAVLFISSLVAELLTRGVTDGDYKGLFFVCSNHFDNKWTFRLFGKTYIDEVSSIGYFMLTFLMNIISIPFWVFMSEEGLDLTNPVSLFLADILLVVLIVAGNYYFAKALYKLVKKVRTLKEVLKTHVNDKDAHSSSSKSGETVYRETGDRVTKEMRDEFKKRFDY
jgi:hypothetical protein